MLYGSLISLVTALIAGVLGFVAVAFIAAGVVKILLFLSLVFFLLSSIRMRRTVPPLCLHYGASAAPHPRTQWGWTIPILTWSRRMRVGSLAAARRIRGTRLGRLRGRRGALYLVTGATVITAALVAAGFHHVYFDRTNLPDIGPFTRYDVRGHPLILGSEPAIHGQDARVRPNELREAGEAPRQKERNEQQGDNPNGGLGLAW